MGYVEEREWKYSQKVAAVTEHLITYGAITTAEAASVAGCNIRTAQRIIADISSVLCLYGEDYLYREGYRYVYYVEPHKFPY